MTFEARLFHVELAEEAVSQLFHDFGEDGEAVGFEILGVQGLSFSFEGYEYDCQHFVHALDVGNARVQFSIHEEYTAQGIRLGLDEVVVLVFAHVALPRFKLLVNSLRQLFLSILGQVLRIGGLLEVVELSSRALDVLLDVFDEVLVSEVVLPDYSELGRTNLLLVRRQVAVFFIEDADMCLLLASDLLNAISRYSFFAQLKSDLYTSSGNPSSA
eukprot:CAMPEP_0170488750 /NCGR_PEP_ID=MMETSP0208-20121228/7227_1 /TAXON_ID=197538 /ORGANISM="Strombidium inclinatum, Strain S3" /LENGTH=214 /DNA_ID=CAMNT_0010763421 /DNA_START=396 /DNA_END=1041 /DNA_ORIENTATION=+